MPKQWMMVLVSAGLLLAACSTSQTNTTAAPVNPELGDALPPDVALNVQNKVSETLGIAAKNVQITQVEKMDWPDACLGLPQGEEACAEVVTPGWLLTFTVNGQAYHYRVDETGTVIRQEP